MDGYSYIVFDIDDTLLDFGAAYAAARKDMAALLGIRDDADFEKLDEKCGWKAWAESRLDDTGDPEVQAHYHEYYMQYVHMHFAYLREALALECDPDKLAACYLDSVSASIVPMEADTLEVYRALSGRYRLVLASNGLTKMQTQRTVPFAPYTYRTYISEAVGAIKPTAAFFEYVLRDLGCRPEECLMVGDSLSNDMRGAKAAGMDVCWYNPRKKAMPEDVEIDFVIGSLRELTEILPQ